MTVLVFVLSSSFQNHAAGTRFARRLVPIRLDNDLMGTVATFPVNRRVLCTEAIFVSLQRFPLTLRPQVGRPPGVSSRRRPINRKRIPERDQILIHTGPFIVPGPLGTSRAPSTSPLALTTESLPPTASVTPEFGPTTLDWLRTRRLRSHGCFRYAYGTFAGNITIIGGWRHQNPWVLFFFFSPPDHVCDPQNRRSR